MKRFFIVLGLLAALAVGVESFARGVGGGHSGGGHGGGGHSFGGGGHTPSFSGGGGAARHYTGGSSRPSFIPQSRPSVAGGSNFRPNTAHASIAQNRPAENRPNNFNAGAHTTLANRPNFAGDNRFSGDNRADFGLGNRANIAQDIHPDWAGGNRADFNGNRLNIDNRANIAAGNLHVGNNNLNVNRNNWLNNNHNWNNNINHWANNNQWNHPWYNHYANWHGDWHHGYWGYWRPGYYPWAWFGAGAALGWWASPGYGGYAYSNPYYILPAVTDAGYYPDYSQPIPPPDEAEQAQMADAGNIMPPGDATDQSQTFADTGNPNTQQAEGLLDQGRTAFKQGNYQAALAKADSAIQLLPSDATLHEFRALCLFAVKRYQESAAGVYAVLAAGPGWDWQTMKALYPDTSVYTTQLRTLENYKKANPNKPDASFLLGYHYLVLGYPDQAAHELEEVVKLQPSDKLSAALLKALHERNNQPPQTPPQATES